MIYHQKLKLQAGDVLKRMSMDNKFSGWNDFSVLYWMDNRQYKTYMTFG